MCAFGSHDVYLNVAGGLRIFEPAADLAVAAALVSSLANAALPADAVYFGEVSLSGVVRPVSQAATPAEGSAQARLYAVPLSRRATRSDYPRRHTVRDCGWIAGQPRCRGCRSKRRSRSPGNEIAPSRRVTARRVEAIHGAAWTRRTRGQPANAVSSATGMPSLQGLPAHRRACR